MGICGLTTFIDSYYSNYWLNVKPKGGMVIDGHSLLHTLYENVSIDWIHGGQYWLLRKHLLELFKCLLSSDIRPIVIMDGFDHTGKRDSIKLNRRQRTLDDIIYNLVECPSSRPKRAIVSILAHYVFNGVLKELGIPFYVVDGEADPVIVAFANHYHCPVVGSDSDYFMYNIECGYIPLKRLYWKTQPVEAEMYKLTDFIRTFGINNIRLSKVIPSVMGCDYIEKLVEPFIDEGVLSTLQGEAVASLVRYISKVESVDQLVRHIRRTLDKGESIAKSLLQNIEKAEEIYDLVDTVSKEQLLHESVLVSCVDKEVPKWLVNQYRNGDFGSLLLNGVVLGRIITKRGIIENPNKPSAMSVCLRIQQSMFTILSPLMKSNEVIVFDRVGFKLSPKVLQFSIDSPTLPTIYSISKLDEQKRISLLCEVTDIDPRVLESFHNQWKLIVVSACYWVKNCNPSTDLIIALIMTFLYCRTLMNPSSVSTTYELLMDLRDMRRTKGWLDTVHTFTCFQCIYHNVVKLNEVLKCPLVTVSPAFFFDGKFAQTYACTDDLKLLHKDFVDSVLYNKLKKTMVDHKPVGTGQTNHHGPSTI